MRRTTAGRNGTLVAAATICVLATASLATAERVTTKQETATLPNDSTTHLVTAECPQGTKTTGGGVRLEDDLNDFAQGSYPQGGRRWTAAGFRNTTGDAAVTAFARCIDAGKLTTKSKTVDSDATEARGAVARCPSGSAVVGGGVEIDDDDVLEVAGSHPRGKRGWRAVARPIGGGTVTATARCLKDAKVVHRQKTFEMPDDDLTHEVTVRCPRKTKLTGGGTELSDPAGNYMQGSYPRGKRGWTASGYDFGTVTAHALCLKKD